MPAEDQEKIRQERIARLNLRLNSESTYFTIGAVILALIALVITMLGFSVVGCIAILVLLLIEIAIIIRQLRIYAKIDELFPLLKELDSK